MVDTLLIDPPDRGPYCQTYSRSLGNALPKLGVLYLIASLRQRGISVDFIDAFIHHLSLEQINEAIHAARPRVVGISANSFQIQDAVHLAQSIRARFGSKIALVLGGPHISADPGFMDRFTEFDAGVCGEGELLFPQLVKDIMSGKKPDRLYGPRPPSDLDALAFPAWDQIKASDYFMRGRTMPTLSTMRGCPYRCVFCSVPTATPVRYHSPRRVLEDIQQLISLFRNDAFQIVDDTFTLDRTHVAEICEGILRMKTSVRWWCQTRADLVDEALVRVMAAAGCRQIWFGIESGDEGIRNGALGKNVTDEQIRSAIAWCHKYHVKTGGYFILGLPGETRADLRKSERFPVRYGLDLLVVGRSVVFYGTLLNHENMKLGKPDIVQEWDRYARGLSLSAVDIFHIPPGMTIKHMVLSYRLMYLWLYLSPIRIFHRLVEAFKSWDQFRSDLFFCWHILRSEMRKIMRIMTLS